MAELTAKQSREGLDFAEDVAALALKAPHLFARRTIREAVDRLRKAYGFKDWQKRKMIADAVENGCRTYADLVGETKLPKPEVVRLVKDMETHEEVILQKLTRGNQGGRAPIYITLTGDSTRKIPEK